MRVEDFTIEEFDEAFRQLQEQGLISKGFYQKVMGFTPEQKKAYLAAAIKHRIEQIKETFLNSLLR